MTGNSAVDRFASEQVKGVLPCDTDYEANCLKVGDRRSSPTLSLGIPVFNGADHIQRSLDSLNLSMQLLEDKHMVEIVFCDNASSDRTEEIIRNFMSSTNYICTYFRHPVNVGLDMNLDALMNVGSGTYVWFLGCGDIIKPDAFIRLLEKLKDLHVSNILLDFDRFSEVDGKIINRSEHGYRHDVFVNGKNDFHFPRYAPAISANVINRDMWIQCLGNPFYVSGWGHVERSMQILSLDEQSRTAIFIEPFFTLFMEEDGWWVKADSFKLHLSHIKAIKSMEYCGFEKQSISRRLEDLNGKVLLRSVLNSSRMGYCFTQDDLKDIRECCDSSVYLMFSIARRLPDLMLAILLSEDRWASIKRRIDRCRRK